MLIVVIASLCFSVGEGLRLTPFPIVEARDTSSTIKPSNQVSNHQYGPLGVPAQHQKRNQRQAVALVFLVTENSYAVPTALHFPATCESTDIVSVLVVSQSAGRSPPFVS